MTKTKDGKGFSEQPDRVSKAGKKGSGSVSGNMKRDPGRAVESGHRSNEERRGASSKFFIPSNCS